MASQVWIRPYDEKRDKIKLAEYLYANREKNRFDPEVFKREQAEIYVAFDSTGVVGFIPVVNGNQVESLAFRPGLSPVTEAKALQSWMKVFVFQSFQKNIPDAFFVTFDQTVQEFAGRYGWKPVVVPMLNLRFANLEKEAGDADND
jgi:hypothetical protein